VTTQTFPSNITIDAALAPFVARGAVAPIPVVTVPTGIAALTIPGSAFEVVSKIAIPSDFDRPLFQAINGNLNIGGNVLNVLGSLSSTSTLPVLSTDPTMITTGADFVGIAPGARMSVNSSVVSDTGGVFNVGGSMVAVDGGGTLTSASVSPVVQLNKTNVSVVGDFVRVIASDTVLSTPRRGGSEPRTPEAACRDSAPRGGEGGPDAAPGLRPTRVGEDAGEGATRDLDVVREREKKRRHWRARGANGRAGLLQCLLVRACPGLETGSSEYRARPRPYPTTGE